MITLNLSCSHFSQYHTEDEFPQTFSGKIEIDAIRQARSKGWLISKKQYLCPKCSGKICPKNVEFYADVGRSARLFRCRRTGLAWVEDGVTGTSHSPHPSIHYTGSVHGMKKRGYWDREDRIIRTQSCYYNTSKAFYSTNYDHLAGTICECGGECKKKQRETNYEQHLFYGRSSMAKS